MQKLKEAINNILDEELVKAKEIIHANLYAKMGALLEQSLLEYAPTVLGDNNMEYSDEEDLGDVHEEKNCEDGDCGDEDTGYSKKKMKSDKEDDKKKKDDEEDEDEKEMNEAFETFTSYLSDLIEEIEQETGEELTEEEIIKLADMVMTDDFDEEN
jgi:hypothetical protein